ncbi:MAG TPA: hypothetical protein VKI20_02070, partial [Acidimicrobiales bacterium]|nr:hypothetical protein [Acidimicrobiales bacterium]
MRRDRARYVIAAPTFGTGWRPTATIGGARPEAGTPSPADAAPPATADPADSRESGGRGLLARITSQPGAPRAIVMTAALSATTWTVIAVLYWLLRHQHRQVAFSSFTDLLGNTA